MQVFEVISFFKIKIYPILLVALIPVVLQISYLIQARNLYAVDVVTISESEQYNEDIVKMLHSESITQNIFGQKIEITASKTSTKQNRIILKSDSLESLMKYSIDLSSYLKEHQVFYFKDKRERCENSILFLKNQIETLSKHPTLSNLDIFRNLLGIKSSNCYLYLGSIVGIINPRAISVNKLSPEEAFVYLRIGLDFDHKMLQRFKENNTTIKVGAPYENAITLKLALSVLLNFIILVIFVTFSWHYLTRPKEN